MRNDTPMSPTDCVVTPEPGDIGPCLPPEVTSTHVCPQVRAEIPAEIESVLSEECRETGAGSLGTSDWPDWQQCRTLIGGEIQAGVPSSSLLEG